MQQNRLIKNFFKSMCYALMALTASFVASANNALDNINSILQARAEPKTAVVLQPSLPMDSSINQAIAALQKDYVFVLFYRLSCPHCRKFDPVLQQFSLNSGIKIKAFTLDGGILPSFPDSSNITPDVVEQYFGKNANIAVPALFIMNTKSLHVFPVASGELSYLELVMRMNDLTPKMLQVEESGHA